MDHLYTYQIILFLASALISLYCIGCLVYRRLIPYFHRLQLLDLPDERKQHVAPTPSSGGLVFGLIALPAIVIMGIMGEHLLSLIACLDLLVLGYLDDRHDLSPRLKFLFQGIAALCITIDIGAPEIIEGFGALNFGIALLFIVGYTNAFNLIDGVDGLAGTYGLQTVLFFAFLFFFQENYAWMVYALVIGTGIMAFLRFNLAPAKIFMGDTGSLFLGLTICVFALKALGVNATAQSELVNTLGSWPVVLSVLILPMLDTVRVMGTRIIKRKSPFKADRTHLHHLLIKLNFGTYGTALFFALLTQINLLGSAYFVSIGMNPLFILFFLASFSIGCYNLLVYLRISQHRRKIARYRRQQFSQFENQLIYRNQILNRA